MSATDDVARLLALVPWLLSRPGATVEEAADTFGVSEETLREDLVHLDFCGLPGFRGGDLFEVDLVGDHIELRMADELRRPLRLGPVEAVRMVLLLETAVRVLDEDLPALRSGLAKVRLAAGVPATVTVDVSDSGADLAPQLRDAARGGRRVGFDYRGRADATPRRRLVDPWAVLVEGGRLYLQGHDLEAGAGRSFRLDRISQLEVLDRLVEHPAQAELATPRYEAHPDDVTFVLRLAPGARWVSEVLDATDVVERRGGRLAVTVRTDAPAWVQELVLQASGGAEILAPPELREELGAKVTVALARYHSSGAVGGHPVEAG